MKKTQTQVSSRFHIFGRRISTLITEIPISKIDTSAHCDMTNLFQKLDAEFRKKNLKRLAENKFQITAEPLHQKEIELSLAEAEVEQLVEYPGIFLLDNDFGLIVHHDLLKTALENKKETVRVQIIREELSEEELFAIQARCSFREDRLGHMDRMTFIGLAIDKFGWSVDKIFTLMTVQGKRLWSRTSIKSEYNVYRIYRDFSGYEAPFGAGALASHHFSRIKELVEHEKIRTAIFETDPSKNKAEHFVNMAIQTKMLGLPRFEKDLAKIMQVPEAEQKLFNNNFKAALEEMQARRPEIDKKNHPQSDLLSANEKMKRRECRELLAGTIKRNPEGNPTLNVAIELFVRIAELDKSAFKRMASALYAVNPNIYAMIIEENATSTFRETKKHFQKGRHH